MAGLFVFGVAPDTSRAITYRKAGRATPSILPARGWALPRRLWLRPFTPMACKKRKPKPKGK